MSTRPFEDEYTKFCDHQIKLKQGKIEELINDIGIFQQLKQSYLVKLAEAVNLHEPIKKVRPKVKRTRDVNIKP